MTAQPYPPAHRSDDADRLIGPHGPVTVEDPYRWLEDTSSAETTRWLQAQGELFAEQQATWPMREHFKTRVSDLMGAGNIGAPIWRGERQFFMRRDPGQEHAALYTIDEPGKDERVLIDPMALDHSGLTTLDSWQPSKEGHLLAYQVSEGGREESALKVMDVASGAIVDGPIDRCRYSPIAWVPGAEKFYYVRRLDPALLPEDEAQYHRRVYLHTLGADTSDDVEIFGAGRDLRSYYGCGLSRDGRWLTISASVGTQPRNDLYLADLWLGDGAPSGLASPDYATALASPSLQAIQEGVDAQASLGLGVDGRLYLWTDRDAPRGSLHLVSPDDPTEWQLLVAEDPEAVMADFAVVSGDGMAEPKLVVAWTRHALSELTVHNWHDGARESAIDLPGPGSLGGLIHRPEGGTDLWFSWTDPTTPSSVRRYDARSGDVSVWAQAPGVIEVPNMHVAQHSYTAPDGVEVRLLLLSPTEQPREPRPTVLYGYGGFGLSMTPGFSAGVLAWVEAGGNYAIANIRGGGEEGEQWHRDGMLANKQNSFDDFHAAAQWLIDQGWTTTDQLGIAGGSNGGLLVGAALTQRPDLYRSVVCSAPLLDMVRYEQFGLGASWNVEYGRADDPEELGWLLSYSPYHQVKAGVDYPAVLFTVFDGDTRVDPLHARKMCAALQYATTSSAPVLLRAEADVGHGARALSRTLDQSADTLAFQAAMLGLTPVAIMDKSEEVHS